MVATGGSGSSGSSRSSSSSRGREQNRNGLISTPGIDPGSSELQSDVLPLHHVEVGDHGAHHTGDMRWP